MMASNGLKVDPNDPNVRRLVYNMYRGILGTYNDKANTIVGNLPKEMVREDQGITRQLESMIRQQNQNQISGGGGSPGSGSPQGDIGVVAPPPPTPPPSGPPTSCPPAPPPPPPPGLGALPTVRLSSEIPDRKKGGYEPPAAIQNAMMTKDKKPFTYTPGGLDLSEIRSPRMARRINRNANAPDSSVPQPRPSPLVNQPLPASAMAAMQPQIAIPVFPQGGAAPQLHHVGAPGHYAAPPPPPPPGQQFNPPQTSPPVQKSQPSPPPPPPQKFSPPSYNQQSPPAMQKSPQTTYSQPSPPPMSVPKSQPQNRSFKQEQSPGSIYIPPIESQQPRAQLGSLYIPPIAQEETKPAVQSPVQLNKAPTPWLSRSQSQREKEVPPWVNREENVPSQPISQPASTQAQTRIIPIQIEGKEQTSTPTNTRIIPIQIEGSNSPVQNTQPNYQQQNQPRQQLMYQQSSAPSTYQQQQSPQQQWQQQQYQQPPQQQWQQQQQYQQPPPPQQQQQQRWKNQQPVYVHNKFNTGSQSPAPGDNDQVDNPKQLQSQQSWGQTAANGTGIAPVQSRSFRVLQKITDTADGTQSGIDQTDTPYNSQGVPLNQLRKLQLSDDDRALMNKVKTQVSDTIEHVDEENPRYRGGYIPSKVFKMLDDSDQSPGSYCSSPTFNSSPQPYHPFFQSNYQSGYSSYPAYSDYPSCPWYPLYPGTPGYTSPVPRTAAQNQIGQNRLGQGQSQTESPQPYIPPSEQQVQEPRKYTGSAIPSRSFRMLQAMTAGSDSSATLPDGRKTPQLYNGGGAMWVPPNGYPTYPNVPPDPNYWYYPQNYPSPTPEQQQQFWDHYKSMCAYIADVNAGYGYPPYGMQSPHLYMPSPSQQNLRYMSDSDECGYSSTDEMTYYGSFFKQNPPPVMPYRYEQFDKVESGSLTPKIVVTPSNSCSNNSELGSNSDKEECASKILNANGPQIKNEDSDEITDDSDTEVEDNIKALSPGLQTIKSVPNINVYHSSSDVDILCQNSETDEQEEDEDEEEDEEEENSFVSQVEDDNLPKQLSIIFEESEHSSEAESIKRLKTNVVEDVETTSDGESSTATLDHCADTDDDIVDPDEATVMVRLPLKLKFSKSENDEDVTTVIVGNSEVKSAPTSPEKEILKEGLLIEEIKKDEEEPEVSVTFTFPKKPKKSVKDMVKEIESINDITKSKDGAKSPNIDALKKTRCVSESPVDFWKEIIEEPVSRKVSDGIISPKITNRSNGLRSSTSETDDGKIEESDCHWEDDSSSTSVQTVRILKNMSENENFSGSEFEAAGTADEVDDIQSQSKQVIAHINNVIADEKDDSSLSDEDDSSTSSSSSSSSDSSCDKSKEKENNTFSDKCCNDNKNDDVFVDCDKNDESMETIKMKKRAVRGESYKSQEESEEDDSGVTSDMSRHISETDTDAECGSEMRKLSRYQRAATHSRLFKLLQDECGGLDECVEFHQETFYEESLSSRKEKLSLPLQNSSISDPDSLSSSSGVNSPSSPTINDRLVNDLVQSLLRRKKGRNFRKLPMEKLQAAALRILQEDMDPYDTVSSASEDSNFTHSPVSDTTTSQANCNTANQSNVLNQEMYGGNYYDYCNYYNSWGNPMYYSNIEASLGYDIVPSRAFRLLQEHAQPNGFSSGAIEGLSAKCPRVLSSKNIPKELIADPSMTMAKSHEPSTDT